MEKSVIIELNWNLMIGEEIMDIEDVLFNKNISRKIKEAIFEFMLDN